MNSELVINLENSYKALSGNIKIEELHKLYKVICEYLSLDTAKPQASLFNLSNKPSDKEYIASAILRIFDSCYNLIWDDPDQRLKVVKLLDETYSDKIHKIIKLDIKSTAHEKLPIYQEISSKALQNINIISDSIVSLETALKIRSRYMKALKNPLNRILLDNQIYNQSLISSERISEFFAALDQYANANRKGKLNTFQRIESIYNSYQEDFKKNISNIYSESFLTNVIDTTFNIAKQDFMDSDLHTEAHIKVVGSKRKYPIHISSKEFLITAKLINEGPGISYNTIINIIDCDDPLSITPEELNLGDLDTGSYEFTLTGRVLSVSTEVPMVIGQVCYLDHEKNACELDFELTIIPQNANVDWDTVKYKQPYSLESVDNEKDLIGRKDLLEIITEKLRLKKMESSIIHGQKRVGKTSLARTIQNRFSDNPQYVCIFIETGSLDKSSSRMFIGSLGEKIIKKIKLQVNSQEINAINPGVFDGSLSPLVSFIEDIVTINEKMRIIIVLDEFDEIPSKLYPYTESGDSFFHSLRSLSGASGEGRLSLILVGGENMNIIMQTTDKLNKFDAYNVGYFDKSKSWKQFSELVKTPVEGIMEYGEEAIVSLYSATEGNPFYSKFIAKNLYSEMANNHISYIGLEEINKSINETTLSMEAINLNHFWSDGIRVDAQEDRDLIETYRRKLLIAFAEEKRNKGYVTKENLLANKVINDIPSEEILESFFNRNIIMYDENNLRIKPKLFETWLIEKGIHSLISSFSDKRALIEHQAINEALYISDADISELVKKWGAYRGQKISAPEVRYWLNQFESNKEKHIMFKLLKNISFYDETLIREKLTVIHKTIRKRIIYLHEKSQKVRKDILLSCLGVASKSGPTILRMYASENKVSTHNIKNFSDINKTITNSETIQSIVFIDDILATGGSIEEGLDELEIACGELLVNKNILVVVGVICGMSDGVDYLEKLKYSFELEIVVCDIITAENKLFSDNSSYFPEVSQRKEAMSICKKYGAQLEKMHPLGYEDSQLLTVFKDSCPNNSLPILWSSSNNPKWIPLFSRH